MLTLNLLKFTDTKGWIHMAHKQDIQADTEEKTSVGKELFQWVLVIIGAVILAFLIDTFVIVNAQIPSGSMENTIMTGRPGIREPACLQIQRSKTVRYHHLQIS